MSIAFTEAYDALLQHLPAETIGRIYIDLKVCPNADEGVWDSFYKALFDWTKHFADNEEILAFRQAGAERQRELNMKPMLPLDGLPWGTKGGAV